MTRNWLRTCALVLGLSLWVSPWAVQAQEEGRSARREAAPARAGTAEHPDLFKAYYLEREAKDYAGAKKLYDAVLSGRPSTELRRAAQAGSDRCRDQLVALNFASLMPEDTMAYIEFNRPGALIEQLAGLFGLTKRSVQEVLAERPSSDSSSFFHVPSEITISPALFKVLSSFGGGAAAVTKFDGSGIPSGLAVMHHGDSDLVKGMMETMFQFAPTAQKVRDLPTFRIQPPGGPMIFGVLTEALFIVSNERDLLEGAVARLQGSGGASLGDRADLREVLSRRQGRVLFGYVDIQQALKIAKSQMGERDRREFEMANRIADLDSFRWVTFSAGISDGSIGCDLAVRLADDHHSIAYNLLRLPPMTRNCLGKVPGTAAGFIGLGLNPHLVLAAAPAADKHVPVSLMDIGREMFGNIQEVCVFVLPGKPITVERERIPNVGLVMAVNDKAKSLALWRQFLSLPGLIGEREATPPKTVEVAGRSVDVFRIPGGTDVFLAEVDGCVGLALSRNTIRAMIAAHEDKKSVLEDAVLSKTLARLPKDSSMMFVAHVGRAAGIAMSMNEGGRGGMSGMDPEAMIAAKIGDICKETVIWAGVGQSHNQFSMAGAIAGLPDLNVLIKQFGPLANIAAASLGTMQQRTQIERTRAAEMQARAMEAEARARAEALEAETRALREANNRLQEDRKREIESRGNAQPRRNRPAERREDRPTERPEVRD